MKCCSIRAVANTSLMISLCCRADFLTIRTYLQQCEGNMWTTSEQHHPRIKQTYIANRVAQGVRPWDDARWDDRYKKQWTGRNQKKFATILQHQTMNGGPQTIETELPDVLHTHGPLRSERPDETFRPESQWLTRWSVVATWSQTCCAHLKNWQRFVTHTTHPQTTGNQSKTLADDFYVRPSTGRVSPRMAAIHLNSVANQPGCETATNAWNLHGIVTSTNPRYLHRCIAVAPICQPHRCDRVYWSHSSGLWCAQSASACAEPW